jgi:hypothetical protein
LIDVFLQKMGKDGGLAQLYLFESITLINDARVLGIYERVGQPR